jgi:hypothetical protein
MNLAFLYRKIVMVLNKVTSSQTEVVLLDVQKLYSYTGVHEVSYTCI